MCLRRKVRLPCPITPFKKLIEYLSYIHLPSSCHCSACGAAGAINSIVLGWQGRGPVPHRFRVQTPNYTNLLSIMFLMFKVSVHLHHIFSNFLVLKLVPYVYHLLLLRKRKFQFCYLELMHYLVSFKALYYTRN